MLGKVYTFERDLTTRVFPLTRRVSNHAIDAIVAAIGGRSGIRYEELTDTDNPKPVIAVLFSDPVQMDGFSALVENELRTHGLKVRHVHMTEGEEFARLSA